MRSSRTPIFMWRAGGVSHRVNNVNLILIGYRGTGKSTVARLLAEQLGASCLDTDLEVERRAAKSIRAIFEEDGEPVFRDLEMAAIHDVLARDNLVVAVGGGAVLRPENRAALRNLGKVIWLRADVETILRRVAADPTNAARRPNLTTAGGRDEVVKLLCERAPLYEQCADLVVDTDDRPADALAAEILLRFEWPR